MEEDLLRIWSGTSSQDGNDAVNWGDKNCRDLTEDAILIWLANRRFAGSHFVRGAGGWFFVVAVRSAVRGKLIPRIRRNICREVGLYQAL